MLHRVLRRRRRAIATLVIGRKAEALFAVARPTFEAYAKRVGASLEVLRHNPLKHRGAPDYFGKWGLHRLLQRYSRVLYIDCDVIIAPDAPDLFAMVPRGKLGAFPEGAHIDRRAEFAIVERALGQIPGWTTDRYFNAGLMLLDNCHAPLFDHETKFNLGTEFHDQTILNWQVCALGIEIHPLPTQANAIYPYVTDPTGAWFTHYAGYGFVTPLRWKSKPDSFPFKFHQMSAHMDRIHGRDRLRFHPEELVLELGQLETLPNGLGRITIPPHRAGLVCYGPFRPLRAGRYRIHIRHHAHGEHRPHATTQLFRFDLASHAGTQIWYRGMAHGRDRPLGFDVEIPALEQAEIRIWSCGSPFILSIEMIEFERLAA